MLEGEELVVDTARRILDRYADPQAVNQSSNHANVRDDADGWKAPLWAELDAAGIVSAWASEAVGGGGASLGLGFELARLAGSFALALPMVESLYGAWLLSVASVSLPEGRLGIAAGSRTLHLGAHGINGWAEATPFARDLDFLALVADDRGRAVVAVVPMAGAAVERNENIAGEPRDHVLFEDTPVLASAALPASLTTEDMVGMGALLRSLQIAGSLGALLDLTVEWAKQRVAFERPIAKFQAIQHSIATLAGEVAAATTAATSAAAAVESEGEMRLDSAGLYLEVAAAKIRCGEAAASASRIAHQVHGAIGVSKEHVLHRFTLRALSWRDDFGDEAHWAADLGRRVSDAGADELWPLLASR